MKILALDTTTSACSAALAVDNAITAQYKICPRQHAQLILPMIDALLATAQLTLKQLDAIAFTQGPGSFTGVRIGAGITQGLAFAANLPVVPLSTLQTVAQGLYETDKATNILVALDARMEEIYWGAYKLGANNIMKPVIADSLATAEEVLLPQNDIWLGAGDGWQQYSTTLQARLKDKLTTIKADVFPNARHMILLAKEHLKQGKTIKAAQTMPLYLRKAVT